MAERSFSEQLAHESEAWVAEGLVSAEQVAALRSRYAAAGTVPQEEPRSRGAAALALIGAIAVGFGVIGFFAANWDGMSHGVRLALLSGAIAGSYAGAFQLRERTGRLPRVGEALYLLGVILFGSSLFLVGQMYNVEAHDPLALLIWAGGAVATAFVVRSRAIAWAALLILTGWVGFEFGTAIDENGGDDAAAFPVVAVFYGGALFGLATVARDRLDQSWFVVSAFAPAARRLGLLLALGGFFVFTFSEAADELGRTDSSIGGWLKAGVLLLVGLALASAVALAQSRTRSGLYEGAALAVVVASMLVAVLVGGSGDAYAIVFNLIFAAIALGAVYAGYLNDEPWLVNLGVTLVAIDLVARYFDLFWSALPRSAGMIGAGVLILAIASLLERKRKQLLTRMST